MLDTQSMSCSSVLPGVMSWVLTAVFGQIDRGHRAQTQDHKHQPLGPAHIPEEAGMELRERAPVAHIILGESEPERCGIALKETWTRHWDQARLSSTEGCWIRKEMTSEEMTDEESLWLPL